MLCSLLQLARRLIKHELGERHSQSIGNSHEYTIIDNGNRQVHEELRSQCQRQSTTPGGSEPQRTARKAAIAQQQRCGGSRMIKIRSYEKRWSEQKESQPLG